MYHRARTEDSPRKLSNFASVLVAWTENHHAIVQTLSQTRSKGSGSRREFGQTLSILIAQEAQDHRVLMVRSTSDPDLRSRNPHWNGLTSLNNQVLFDECGENPQHAQNGSDNSPEENPAAAKHCAQRSSARRNWSNLESLIRGREILIARWRGRHESLVRSISGPNLRSWNAPVG